MSQAPFMQLYVGDYLADTLDLTCEEHGAYLLLLMTMWRHGARLPNDPKKLARIARVHPPRWARIWDNIGGFFEENDGFITNARLAKEYEKACHKSQSRAQAGAAGGRAKALKTNNPHLAIVTSLPKHSSEPEPELREEREEPPLSPKGEKPRRACSLPQGWVPSERNIADAVARNFSEKEIYDEADKFRDYHHAKGTRFKDWDAGWRTWLGNARKFAGRGMAGQANTSRHGQGSSIASIVARRRADGSV